MQNVYKNIEEYNPEKKRKVLIVLDDMIADMISDKKLNSISTEPFIRGRKLTFQFFHYAKKARASTNSKQK